ncbi:conserved hypothetical protein [Gloeothece citriformis PCC 7424]|uniref:T6SS Phospholipase effector Tle1-like catalytic domain-containing protein n=1 Tax=Gloeothece citriformis (strain PCC 7424) TaxID=65393 RepID=B7KJY4_GLOC7|nr:DUF2235 domain-containing protein [Gloeothece citriformis]ACK69583.1 conserved hypothetical protein [Gloeothece citriformis PCC 7424]
MKRLIVCSDGTWQDLNTDTPTNVVKIAQGITTVDRNQIPQLVFYQQGLGTQNLKDRITGGVFGLGIDAAIQQAYSFLCLNYDPGDEIYLFGFSRGAYTVRSLAGFIYNCGLLQRPHIRRIPEAYELYRDRSEEKRPSSKYAIEYRQQYAQQEGAQVPIHLLGCWDTVGSLGVPDLIPFLPFDNWLNHKYQFHDTTLNRQILHARHGVAVDEIREVFNVTPMDSSFEGQDIKQIWFPGDHSGVGGGSLDKERLSDGALDWMIKEAENLGLEFDRSCVENGIHPNYKIDFDNQPEGIFKLMKTISRKISDFNNLDDTVKMRWRDRKDYRPENLDPFILELEKWSNEHPK